jgi:5-methylcytosine-specific restriction endonuclease McrA
MKIALSWKKYYQMAAVALVAFVLYWLIKKNPSQAKNIIASSNEYIKYLPVDRNTSSMIAPILDFTSKQTFVPDQYNGGYSHPIIPMDSQENKYEQRILNSGKKSTKRSVSETKKKFVAARQNWHCEDCKNQLPAWFEVDHKIRLEHGGSNHVDNLVALCRDCHGKKTAIENL